LATSASTVSLSSRNHTRLEIIARSQNKTKRLRRSTAKITKLKPSYATVMGRSNKLSLRRGDNSSSRMRLPNLSNLFPRDKRDKRRLEMRTRVEFVNRNLQPDD
ncbi:hypothetical protein K0M31_007984, partial [Melipona bicolor]